MTDFLVEGSTSQDAGGSAFSADESSLVVDGGGRIEACSAHLAASLGWPAETLVGLPVSTVIEKLPFAVNTPGYNLAYAVFHSTGRVWIRSIALSAQGLKIPVDIALSKVVVKGKCCIGLRLRPPLNLPRPGSPSIKGLEESLALTPVAWSMKTTGTSP